MECRCPMLAGHFLHPRDLVEPFPGFADCAIHVHHLGGSADLQRAREFLGLAEWRYHCLAALHRRRPIPWQLVSGLLLRHHRAEPGRGVLTGGRWLRGIGVGRGHRRMHRKNHAGQATSAGGWPERPAARRFPASLIAARSSRLRDHGPFVGRHPHQLPASRVASRIHEVQPTRHRSALPGARRVCRRARSHLGMIIPRLKSRCPVRHYLARHLAARQPDLAVRVQRACSGTRVWHRAVF